MLKLIIFIVLILAHSRNCCGKFVNPTSKSIPKYDKVAAAIVEHRAIPNLPYVMSNFLENLSKEIIIYFFCSIKSAAIVKSNLLEGASAHSLKRVRFIQDFFGELNATVMSKVVYNRLLLDHTFWLLFSRDKKDSVVLFESDSFLCSNPTFELEKFLNYGYIGAPWMRRPCKSCKLTRLRHARNRIALPVPVGNSGLSVMNTKVMLTLTSKNVSRKTKNLQDITILRGGCDVYISTVLQSEYMKNKALFRFRPRIYPDFMKNYENP